MLLADAIRHFAKVGVEGSNPFARSNSRCARTGSSCGLLTLESLLRCAASRFAGGFESERLFQFSCANQLETLTPRGRAGARA